MREIWLRKNTSKRLLIFFSGFASDEKLLRDFKDFADADFLMLCDYGNLDFPVLPKYERVDVVAWSFGVWVANYFRDKIGNATSFTCINATPFAVDDERGIPNAIFKATCENFNEITKEKFFLRICESRKYYQEHRHFLTDRSAESLKAELEFLGKAFAKNTYYKGKWDRVIFSKKDKIYPVANLLKVFPDAELCDTAHFDVSLIYGVLKSVINRGLEIRKSFEKNMQSYERNAKVQAYIAENLAKTLEVSSGKRILELGAGTGFLTKLIAEKFSESEFFINDLSEIFCKRAVEYAGLDAKLYAGDLMLLDFEESYDLIVSSSCFQWIENQVFLYEKMHKMLNVNGVLCFSTFSKNNFKEVTQLTGKTLKYLNEAEIVELLESVGFDVLEARTESIVKTFSSPMEVLKHIKSTGVNATFKAKWTKASLQNFCENYENNGEGYPLTYEAIYIKAIKRI